MPRYNWQNANQIEPKQFTCGHCNRIVASVTGYFVQNEVARIYVCPNCTLPTFFQQNEPIPGVAYGGAVEHISDKPVEDIYEEARQCMSVSAHTATALACRKLLMNIAVAHGAKQGETFSAYVDHLVAVNVVPPNCKAWIDHIRTKGNEATHEINIVSKADAEQLVSFCEMLLKLVYEFPGKLKPVKP